MKIELSERDASLVIAALFRACDWTAAVIDGLKGCTDPSDRAELVRERRARDRYLRLRHRIERVVADADPQG